MLAPAATSEGAAVWRCCAEDATADADAFCEVNALWRPHPTPPESRRNHRRECGTSTIPWHGFTMALQGGAGHGAFGKRG